LVAIAGLGSPNHGIRLISPISANAATKAYLARYEVDRRSIFVGNLPVGTVEAQIRDLFESYGTIEEITVREGLSKFESESTFTLSSVLY
jgi:RNA recognition motif-containing protein